MTNYRLFELKVFVDDNLKFDQIGRKFSQRIENTVEKKKNVRYEQILLSSQCFQKTVSADM